VRLKTGYCWSPVETQRLMGYEAPRKQRSMRQLVSDPALLGLIALSVLLVVLVALLVFGQAGAGLQKVPINLNVR